MKNIGHAVLILGCCIISISAPFLEATASRTLSFARPRAFISKSAVILKKIIAAPYKAAKAYYALPKSYEKTMLSCIGVLSCLWVADTIYLRYKRYKKTKNDALRKQKAKDYKEKDIPKKLSLLEQTISDSCKKSDSTAYFDRQVLLLISSYDEDEAERIAQDARAQKLADDQLHDAETSGERRSTVYKEVVKAFVKALFRIR